MIAGEKEQLVFENRAAQGAAEVIYLEGRPANPLLVVPPGICIQGLISYEVGGLAMELVGPGL